MRTIVAGIVLLSSIASAQEKTPPDVTRGERYDGRKINTGPKKAVLALPRVLLGVPRLVVLGVTATARPLMEYSERHHVPERVLAAITTPDGKEGVRPIIDYETAFRPAAGALYFNDRIPDGGRFVVSLATGGPDTIMTGTRATVPLLRERLRLDVGVDYRRRSDELYTGIGMPAHARFSRYGIDQLDGTFAIVAHPLRALTISVGEDVGLRRYNAGSAYGGDPDIDDVYCVRDKHGRCIEGSIDDTQVPGFTAGTQFARETVAVHIDSRRQETSPGLIVDGAVAYTHGLGRDGSSYLRLHGRVGTQLEVWRRRSLYVGVAVDDELAFGSTPIPFTELVTLGGPNDLRGFARGRFRDASSMLATVEWRWPVWMWMDGVLFFDYGGAFGPGFRDFSVSALRPDVGIGFIVHTSNKYVMRIQAAWGFGDLGGFRLVIAGNGSPS
jgi:hypothetical protein